MDYKNALQKLKREQYNREHSRYCEVLQLVYDALEPYEKYSAIRKPYLQAIQEQLKDKVVKITFDHDRSGDGYGLHIIYTESVWHESFGKDLGPRETNSQTYVCSAYKDPGLVRRAILEDIESRKRWDAKKYHVADYAVFYRELEILCDKHLCAEKAIQKLMER